MGTETLPRAQRAGRVAFFDALRGLTIISMVAFHTCYDLAYLYGISLPWFAGTWFQTVWRCSISWVFLLLAGWMTSFSRNNLRRGLIYAGAAAVVYAATAIVSVDTAISFGILYCMAASTLVFVVLEPLLKRVHPLAALVVFLACFALTYGLPHARYEVQGLAWLGFPSAGFSSGDYYPLLPYCFMYLAGASAARLFSRLSGGSYPAWMREEHLRPLCAIGRQSLIIYLLHQPLILVVLELVL